MKQPTPKLSLGRGLTGKHLYRLRQHHVARHLVPLMSSRCVGAAKLDILLRCVALSPKHAGRRQPGVVLRKYSWAQLYDLVKSAHTLGPDPEHLDPSPAVLRLKRKWVGEQLGKLETMNLLERKPRPGDRPDLIVLRDDGSGQPFDDPGDKGGDTYVSVLGTVIKSGHLAKWGAPEVSAYLACMLAEGYDPARDPGRIGRGEWFRQLAWFADPDGRYGPAARIKVPFSTSTLERGIAKLEKEGLLSHERVLTNPRTGDRLRGPRNLYRNRFPSPKRTHNGTAQRDGRPKRAKRGH